MLDSPAHGCDAVVDVSRCSHPHYVVCLFWSGTPALTDASFPQSIFMRHADAVRSLDKYLDRTRVFEIRMKNGMVVKCQADIDEEVGGRVPLCSVALLNLATCKLATYS